MLENNKIIKFCDICLVTLPDNWASGQLPYYYLYLAGYLENKDYRVEILDLAPYAKTFSKNKGLKNFYRFSAFDKDLYFARIINNLKNINPRFVGLAAFTTDYFLAMELAALVKKEIGCRIIMGNVHPSLFPDDCIYEGSPVDFVVIGEGEATLAELLDQDRRGGDFSNISGLYFWHDGQPVRTATRELIDISDLPLIPFKKVDMEYYLKPRQILIRNLVFSGVGLLTGRGCPYFCTFCAANSIYKAQGVAKRVRHHSLDSVFLNIEVLVKKYKIDALYIMDDTFTVLPDRVLEFCERIKKLGIYWGAETRANLINRKLLLAMKDSGCVQLDFGVESGSPEMLTMVKKAITVDQTITAFKLCREFGIRTLANILINLPGEEEKHIKETEDLLKIIKPTVINVSILKPFPATPIFDDFVKMTHVEYIRSLKNFLAGDRSIFRLCLHNLDLDKLNKDLRKYSYKTLKQTFKELKISLGLILKSSQKLAYLFKYFRMLAVKVILILRRIKNLIF